MRHTDRQDRRHKQDRGDRGIQRDSDSECVKLQRVLNMLLIKSMGKMMR